MKRTIVALVLLLAMSSAAQTATLTITPDKQIYEIGEQIVLSVFGDAEGAADNFIIGRIRFDSSVAEYVSSAQEPLTSFGGGIPWVGFSLFGGDGFADAFIQFVGDSPFPVDGPLTASVVLLATQAGTLEFSWETTGDLSLDFFGLRSAPGGNVTIVPEPATGALMALGLVAICVGRRR